MIRTILISTTVLALAGAAQAADMKVSLAGKTESTIRSELFQAAKAVCRDVSVADYSSCVTETYQNALLDVAKAKATKLASLTF